MAISRRRYTLTQLLIMIYILLLSCIHIGLALVTFIKVRLCLGCQICMLSKYLALRLVLLSIFRNRQQNRLLGKRLISDRINEITILFGHSFQILFLLIDSFLQIKTQITNIDHPLAPSNYYHIQSKFITLLNMVLKLHIFVQSHTQHFILHLHFERHGLFLFDSNHEVNLRLTQRTSGIELLDMYILQWHTYNYSLQLTTVLIKKQHQKDVT